MCAWLQARAFYGFQIAIENIHSGEWHPPTPCTTPASLSIQPASRSPDPLATPHPRRHWSATTWPTASLFPHPHPSKHLPFLPLRPPPPLSEMYSLLLETYIKDSKEKDRLFHSIDTVPCIKKKAQWAIKWINRYVAGWAVPPGAEWAGWQACTDTPLRTGAWQVPGARP